MLNLCSNRIIHGVEDETVPFERSLKLMEAVVAEDVDLVSEKNINDFIYLFLIFLKLILVI